MIKIFAIPLLIDLKKKSLLIHIHVSLALCFSGQLNSDIHVPESNKKIFSDLVADLRKALKKCDQNDSVLPIECHYLNKNAFISVVGHQPQQTKHFTLKRKPKAAALKVELLNKAQVFKKNKKTEKTILAFSERPLKLPQPFPKLLKLLLSLNYFLFKMKLRKC